MVSPDVSFTFQKDDETGVMETFQSYTQRVDRTEWLSLSLFARNITLVSLIFLRKSLVFPILLFSSISLHWSLRKAFLFLFAVLWNSAFRWIYLSFSLLPFTSLLFSAICKVSSDYHFACLHFYILGMVLIMASWTMLWISVHSYSGTLCTRSNPLNLFLTSSV